MWCGAISCLITIFSPFAHLTREGVIQKKYLLLADKARNKGMVWNNVRYDKKFAILVLQLRSLDSVHTYRVHFFRIDGNRILFFACPQEPQACVWTVMGTQKPTYEPYGNGPQTVQNRAKNTSNVHRSSHSYAHTIIQ